MEDPIDLRLLGKGVDILAAWLGPLPVIVVGPGRLVEVVGGREAKDMYVAAEVESKHDPHNALGGGQV